MDEYIEREAAIEKLNEIARMYISGKTFQGNFAAGIVCDIRDYTIEKITAADVAPVRHGRWNADETCSYCGKKSTEGLDDEKWGYWFPDYCPNCGAKMDGGGNG